MEVTPFGMEMLVRLLHLEKADFPMDVTLSGMEILVSLSHLSKAPLAMVVIVFGRVKSELDFPIG